MRRKGRLWPCAAVWALVACAGATSPGVGQSGSLGSYDGGKAESGVAPPEACHAEAGARLACDPSLVGGVPWGPFVTVQRGSGEAPVPRGGPVAPGAYQLVSETIYGGVEPHTTTPRPGDRVRRTLRTDCDVMYELYQTAPDLGAGNDCRRLVTRQLDALDVSGWIASSGPPLPDLRDEVAYTANGTDLTLLFLYAYGDMSRSIDVLGTYTVESRFVLVSGDGGRAAVPSDGGASIFPVPDRRDPRCPAAPPADGDPCSPDPAPLECEYGGDSFHRCTTFAACVLATDGTFHFSLDPPSRCTPNNPTGCPPTFAAARSLAARGGVSLDGGASDAGSPLRDLVCNYAEGVCGCAGFPPSSDCAWTCVAGPSLADGGVDSHCPMPRPLAGDPCPTGLECAYEATCDGPTSLGHSMICQNGYWADRGDWWMDCVPP